MLEVVLPLYNLMVYTWSELCKGILATVVCKPHG